MSNTLPLAFISMPGGLEWVVIGLVALLIFGKRLPGVARSLGQALHEFKNGFANPSERQDNPPPPDGDQKPGSPE
ncbi:MAG: twin-arginine translocase TatA/TatE family subunit [Planctomycetota bacterium]|jgi:sec-independent protein translocase protein TatA|nr:twin-arginine translocase TatA/TatE family subunit [Planctomycetota bacterium]